MTKRPKAPVTLGPTGRRLWRDIVRKWDLRPDELRILLDAGATADLVDDLAGALETAGVTSTGSKGQPRVNPLVPELQRARDLLARLLGKLDLPDAPKSFASQRASDAARTRWSLEEARKRRRRGKTA